MFLNIVIISGHMLYYYLPNKVCKKSYHSHYYKAFVWVEMLVSLASTGWAVVTHDLILAAAFP